MRCEKGNEPGEMKAARSALLRQESIALGYRQQA